MHVRHLARIGRGRSCLGGRGRAAAGRRTLLREAEHQHCGNDGGKGGAVLVHYVPLHVPPMAPPPQVVPPPPTDREVSVEIAPVQQGDQPTPQVWHRLRILLMVGCCRQSAGGCQKIDLQIISPLPSPVLPLTAVQCTTSPSFASHIQET